jgi:hypothetical protein
MSVPVGFTPDEINTSESTRTARLKWVIVVDEALPAGRAVNAAVCVASATTAAVAGLLGPDATDAGGSLHPGLPWAGCSVLSATAEQLAELHAKAARSEGVYVADMPVQAQTTRVYDEYLGQLATAVPDEIAYYAVSIIGPRNRIAKLVKPFPLLA